MNVTFTWKKNKPIHAAKGTILVYSTTPSGEWKMRLRDKETMWRMNESGRAMTNEKMA